jgi:hypothetical protein
MTPKDSEDKGPRAKSFKRNMQRNVAREKSQLE